MLCASNSIVISHLSFDFQKKLLTGVGDAKNLQFLLCQANAAKHQPVAAKGFNRVDAHTAHQFLDLMPPGSHQIDKTLAANIRVQAFDQLRTLGSDAPIAFAALAGAAQVAAQSQHGGGGDIAGIRT